MNDTIDINELMSPTNIAVMWNEVVENRIPYMGETFFGTTKQFGLTLSQIKGTRGLPVALKASTFDALATVRPRIGVSKIETELPFFRESHKLTEKQRRDLATFRNVSPQLYTDLIAQIYDDARDLIEGALVVNEQMRWSLLTDMSITIASNEADYDYNFDPDGSWHANNFVQLTGTDLWTDFTNSNPLEDIQTGIDHIASTTGETITRVVMNTQTFNLLRQNVNIKNYITINNNDFATASKVRDLFSSELGITIEIYDKQFRSTQDDGTTPTQKFLPDGYVILLPDGQIGTTVFSYTPEEIDSVFLQNNGASVSVVETGVTLTSIVHNHPVHSELICSEICLPSIERAESVYTIKVTA